MAVETLIVKGRRVLVERPRAVEPAARAMAAAGVPAARICAVLSIPRERLNRALAPVAPSIWGRLAAALAEEMRRATDAAVGSAD